MLRVGIEFVVVRKRSKVRKGCLSFFKGFGDRKDSFIYKDI